MRHTDAVKDAVMEQAFLRVGCEIRSRAKTPHGVLRALKLRMDRGQTTPAQEAIYILALSTGWKLWQVDETSAGSK